MAGNLDILEDACGRLPHLTRAMFGGHGLFAPNDGMFAGIVDDDRIILKLADTQARQELVALGGAPWTYAGKMTMKEWIVIPDEFYDDADTLSAWVARAHALAPARKRKGASPRGATKAASKSNTPAKAKAGKAARKKRR